jgi:hypothetical protein
LAEAPAAEAVEILGCTLCHGEGALFADRWENLGRRSVDDLTRWILDPQTIKPGTIMPNFGEIMTEDVASRVAAWLRDGRNPE